MKKHKVIHFRKKCIGCNSCVSNAPQTWIMDKKDGKASLIGAKEKRGVFVAEIFDCDLADNKRAKIACPMQIIRIEEGKI